MFADVSWYGCVIISIYRQFVFKYKNKKYYIREITLAENTFCKKGKCALISSSEPNNFSPSLGVCRPLIFYVFIFFSNTTGPKFEQTKL